MNGLREALAWLAATIAFALIVAVGFLAMIAIHP